MAKWSKLDTRDKDIEKEPWDLYWSEAKSTSSEFQEFMLNPKKEAKRDLEGVDDSYTVQTTILNHEIGLAQDLVCKVALVDPGKKIVYFTLYKHPIKQ